ncbi:MAG: hypothetical protein HC862_02670 [Scytonema sp. RU_4_4]|nr:hypothetical protein [Scytonema sp. RU_4_4]NJR75103.1 hypothetical protein [Scytonema sp. CRU_2_7]
MNTQWQNFPLKPDVIVVSSGGNIGCIQLPVIYSDKNLINHQSQINHRKTDEHHR